MADKPLVFVFGHNVANSQTPFHVSAWEQAHSSYYISVVANPTTGGTGTGTCTETSPATETNWDSDDDNSP